MDSGTKLERPGRRGVGRAVLLTAPMVLWSLLMMTPRLRTAHDGVTLGAALAVAAFMSFLFYEMMRTGETYRWRRIFFVALGLLFPVGFLSALVALRGTMSIPIEHIVAGDTPFCFMVTPMLLIPAALTRTIIFPGSILATANNPHSIATMIGLWAAMTLVLGKAWCSYGCFFGGIEEGFAAVAKRPLLRRIDARFRLAPWAVLLATVLLSAALFEPVYCTWLCPFKTVTEFFEVRNALTAMQFVVFITLFAGLVVVLPLLTKKRTQCGFFCPFGAFQSIFNKINIFEIRVDRARCVDCGACQRACPTMAITPASVQAGGVHLNCMRCGACVDVCRKEAAVWHVKGTALAVKPERARLLFLYGAWAMATMFGGSVLAGSLVSLVHLLVRA